MLECEKRECARLLRKMSKSELFRPLCVVPSVEEKKATASPRRNLESKVESLEEALEKLKNNEYESFEEWCEHIRHRWQRPMKELKATSMLYSIYEAQDDWFMRKCMKIPHSGKDAWILCLSRLTRKLRDIFEFQSNPESVL